MGPLSYDVFKDQNETIIGRERHASFDIGPTGHKFVENRPYCQRTWLSAANPKTNQSHAAKQKAVWANKQTQDKSLCPSKESTTQLPWNSNGKPIKLAGKSKNILNKKKGNGNP